MNFLMGHQWLPNVSGIASVLRSFYPKYSASKIKEIILESGIQMYSSLKRE